MRWNTRRNIYISCQGRGLILYTMAAKGIIRTEALVLPLAVLFSVCLWVHCYKFKLKQMMMQVIPAKNLRLPDTSCVWEFPASANEKKYDCVHILAYSQVCVRLLATFITSSLEPFWVCLFQSWPRDGSIQYKWAIPWWMCEGNVRLMDITQQYQLLGDGYRIEAKVSGPACCTRWAWQQQACWVEQQGQGRAERVWEDALWKRQLAGGRCSGLLKKLGEDIDQVLGRIAGRDTAVVAQQKQDFHLTLTMLFDKTQGQGCISNLGNHFPGCQNGCTNYIT